MTKQPSWTWASDLSKVQFHVGICTMNQDLVIVSALVKPQGLDRFGQVLSGELVVNGRLRKGVMRNCWGQSELSARFYGTDQQDALVGQVILDFSQRSVMQNGNQSKGREITALLVAQDFDTEAENGGKWCALALEPVSAREPPTLDGLGLFKETSG